MTTTTTSKIGPKMREAIAFVAENPGCPKLPVAEHVGPNGSRRYGYATVDRCIAAGLICANRGENGVYSLTLPR